MTSDTTTLRYDGPSPRVRVPAFGIDVAPGEAVDIDADATVPGEADETRPLAEMLTERLGFERVRQDTDILNGTIDDVQAALATGEYDDCLDALAHAEREGKNRTGALTAIDARREEL